MDKHNNDMSISNKDSEDRVTNSPANQKNHRKRRREADSPTRVVNDADRRRGGTEPWSICNRDREGAATSLEEEADGAGFHHVPH